MTIGELYKKYLDVMESSKVLNLDSDVTNGNIEKLFQESFEFVQIAGSAKLALVRMLMQSCLKTVGEYEYIDYGLLKITKAIMVAVRLTNLELDNKSDAGDDADESAKTYDMIYEMGLIEYLENKYEREITELYDFLYCEERTVNERNSVAAILAKNKGLNGKAENEVK